MNNARKGCFMPRRNFRRSVTGSVSFIAMTTLLVACSQRENFPALQHSNISTGQVPVLHNPGARPFIVGQPVYQASVNNGLQSYPVGTPVYRNTQFGAANVPGNQVASLGGGFETYGIVTQPQPAPRFSPILSNPVQQNSGLLSPPPFQQEIQSVNQSFGGGFVNGFPPPFQGLGTPVQAAPGVPFNAINTVEPVPVDIGPQRNSGFGYSGNAFVPPSLDPQNAAPRPSIIEETVLAPPVPPRAPDVRQPTDNIPQVGYDYTTLPNAGLPSRPSFVPLPADQDFSQPAPYAAYENTFTTSRLPPDPRRTGQSFTNTAVPDTPANQDRARNALELLLQQDALPAPDLPRRSSPVQESVPEERAVTSPRTEPAEPSLRFGGGLRVPQPSTEYGRPYALLRPGIWPELETPGIGLVQAPPPTPSPALVPVQSRPAPVQQFAQQFTAQSIAQASERNVPIYEIRQGDTLLSIAQSFGVTPERLALENGFVPQATIYIGQRLSIPASNHDDNQRGRITDIEIVDVDTDQDALERIVSAVEPFGKTRFVQTKPIQRASIPFRNDVTDAKKTRVDTPGFSWPVHGDVYRLNAGQIEIDSGAYVPVMAVAAGKVVHVERGSRDVLVVIEHDNGWRSLTFGLDYSAVRPGTHVEQGGMLGRSSRDHRVRFELRDAGSGIADALQLLRG